MDLSEDSNQPFLFEHLSMVFNGEVYNYLELRRELQQLGYSFETSSDTEVILKSYHCWGEASVARFVGMWALAIWDDRKNQLFCSRDRFGIKPFVYQKQPDGTFSFASEIKALKKSPGFAKKLNVDQANLGLGLGWVGCGTETYYHGIESLSPAHNLVLDRGGLRIVPYWTLDPHSKRQQSPLELQREFAALFNQSLEIHLRSQVEVGACLSGGIDSSAIVSSICGDHPDRILKVFHIYYSDYVDERPFAQHVLHKYPNTEAHYYSPDANDLSDYFAGAGAAAAGAAGAAAGAGAAGAGTATGGVSTPVGTEPGARASVTVLASKAAFRAASAAVAFSSWRRIIESVSGLICPRKPMSVAVMMKKMAMKTMDEMKTRRLNGLSHFRCMK
jgi:asparagine synthase (glutamine-hydrolysing)